LVRKKESGEKYKEERKKELSNAHRDVSTDKKKKTTRMNKREMTRRAKLGQRWQKERELEKHYKKRVKEESEAPRSEESKGRGGAREKPRAGPGRGEGNEKKEVHGRGGGRTGTQWPANKSAGSRDRKKTGAGWHKRKTWGKKRGKNSRTKVPRTDEAELGCRNVLPPRKISRGEEKVNNN